MAKEETKKRRHRALYSKDKYTGGWNVRIIGPDANKFAGREVPVERADKTENMEKLTELVWTGIDDGSINPADKGQNVALYKFAPHPKDQKEVEF